MSSRVKEEEVEEEVEEEDLSLAVALESYDNGISYNGKFAESKSTANLREVNSIIKEKIEI